MLRPAGAPFEEPLTPRLTPWATDLSPLSTMRRRTGSPMKQSSLIPVERIERAIYLIRGEKVMLDRDLAALYEVETRALNQAVGRNRDRFPPDFMFELTREEILGISQIVTSSNLKFSKRVTAFTEQGVAMLASILRSKRAVLVNIQIMRAFVRLRQMLASNAELSRRFDE